MKLSNQFLFGCLIGALPNVGTAGGDLLFANGFEGAAVDWQVTAAVAALATGQPGRALELDLNGVETLTITADGNTPFQTRVANGQAYSVTIVTQPQSGAPCTLADAQGVALSSVTVEIDCSPGQTLWDQFNWDQADWQ